MMKSRYIICALAIAASFASYAQSLQLPDDAMQNAPAQLPADGDTAAAESADKKKVKAIYSTPSESYKAERNAIRKGNGFFEKKDFYRALEEYENALQINDRSIIARYNKAVALLELQNEDNKGTSKDPRALAAEQLNELLEDARLYNKDIAAKSFYNLGNIAFNDSNFSQAIDEYKNSLRIRPDSRETRQNLRLAQLRLQQQQNQDQQNQDKQQDQDKKDQEKQDQQQQDQQQQQQDQQQQQQEQPQQQQQPMTQSAQQILQTMQNKENSTRKKVQEQEPAVGRPQSDKPW